MNAHYTAVLDDLRHRKATVEAELQEIVAAMAAIERLLGRAEAHSVEGRPAQETPKAGPQTPSPSTRYANISVRWAVLWHLYESGDEFQRTSDIAKAVREGGRHPGSDPDRFPNSVSAVLSKMRGTEVETDTDGGGHRLTKQGRLAWELIRQGAKFHMAMGEVPRPS